MPLVSFKCDWNEVARSNVSKNTENEDLAWFMIVGSSSAEVCIAVQGRGPLLVGYGIVLDYVQVISAIVVGLQGCMRE